MKIMQSNKRTVADNVLAALMDIPGPAVSLEGFVNCREQGYSLTNYQAQVAFSEARGSNEIVVFFGKTTDFSMQGNVQRERDATRGINRSIRVKKMKVDVQQDNAGGVEIDAAAIIETSGAKSEPAFGCKYFDNPKDAAAFIAQFFADNKVPFEVTEGVEITKDKLITVPVGNT